MKIFLDSADLNVIEKAMSFGIVDGITTNPSLVARQPLPFSELIRELVRLVPGPISLEVTATDPETMLVQARELAALGDQVVIKVPINLPGLQVVKTLSDEGIKTNVTLIFSASQALLAAKAGATYVSPFVGRIDDISGDGMQLVEDIVQIYDNYSLPTEVIAASIRHPLHFVQAALAGADVATIPYATLERLLDHPLTEKGMEAFLKDWASVKQ